MAITTKSDRKTESIELAEVRLCVLVVAWTGIEQATSKTLETLAKTGLGEHDLFKFFDSFDLTNNIR